MVNDQMKNNVLCLKNPAEMWLLPWHSYVEDVYKIITLSFTTTTLDLLNIVGSVED
jgi:hypothetical protein